LIKAIRCEVSIIKEQSQSLNTKITSGSYCFEILLRFQTSFLKLILNGMGSVCQYF
jgi:hypothetical protein